MKAKLAVGALVVSLALLSQAWAVELLPGLRGLKGGPCCEACGAPVKCAVPEPKACAPAGETACEVCCKPRHDLLVGLKHLLQKKRCAPCEAAAPVCEPVKCVVPEPKACEPAEPACCPPCREKLLKKLLGRNSCCPACEPKACEPKAAEVAACEPCGKCRAQLVLKMLHALFGKKCCCEVEECDGCGPAAAPASPAPTPAPKAAEPAPLPKAPKPDAEAQLNPPRSISQTIRHVARY